VPPDAPAFHADRPSDLRAAPRWHRLYHIINALPRGLEQLVPELGVSTRGRVLDYGCADLPYRRFFGSGVDYVGADLSGNPDAALEILPDGRLAASDGSFDALMSTQVLEHVQDPAVYLEECFRVLRPGGRMLLSTHGIMVYHPDPVDCWRWTCAGLQRQVESAGFRIARFEGIMGLAATGLQLFQDSIWWVLPRPLKAPFAFVMQTLVGALDRLQTAESKRLNALVFALVAVKPEEA
jgi:SAM-dependent methyltransferase